MKMEKTLYELICTKTFQSVIEKSNSTPGSNLNDVKMSIMQFKDILYDSLMNMELDDIKEKWNRTRPSP